MSATNINKKKKVQRGYNVSTKGMFKRYIPIPKIEIKGEALNKIGCVIGDFVRVIVADTYIQIVKDTTPGKEVANV